jgi:parallel beta-helix repeat protein
VKKPGLAQVQFFWHGTGSINDFVSVTAMDHEKNLVYTNHKGSLDQFIAFSPDYRFVIENLPESLDQPGEWSLDWEDGKLFFWPTTDLRETDEVVAPALSNLVELRRTRWVTISGFTFTETISEWPMRWWQPGHHGNAVVLDGARHCAILKNRFRGVGINALLLVGGKEICGWNTVERNEIAHAGGWGIVLTGATCYNEISNNEVHHCGDFFKSASGIAILGSLIRDEDASRSGLVNEYAKATSGKTDRGFPDGNLVAHNHVHDLPRDGINLGISPYGRNIAEYNLVERTALETSDTGGIRCHRFHVGLVKDLAAVVKNTHMVGCVIRYNVVTDQVGCSQHNGIIVAPKPWPTMGIYLDEGCSNCLIYGNLIARGGVGLLINPGAGNRVENNVFIDCKQSFCFQAEVHFTDVMHFMTGNIFSRNICYASDPKSAVLWFQEIPETVLAPFSSDYNVFFNTAGKYCFLWRAEGSNQSLEKPLAEWVRSGHDSHSIMADPMFVDLKNGDYRLKPESPALKLGLVPIDWSKAGIEKEN